MSQAGTIPQTIIRSIFNESLASRFDAFTNNLTPNYDPVTQTVEPPVYNAPIRNQQIADPQSRTDSIVRQKENELLVASVAEQTESSVTLVETLQETNELLEDLNKTIGSTSFGSASDGGGGFGLGDLLDNTGRSGGRSIARGVGSLGRRIVRSRGGKFAIGAGLLAAGGYALNRIFNSSDEEDEYGDVVDPYADYYGDEDQDSIIDNAGGVASTIGTVASVSGGLGARVAKTAGGGLFKSALKKIPGVGVVAGAAAGVSRALGGDFLGALGELASGVASIVPGLGTLASVAIDGALAVRDFSDATQEQERSITDVVSEQLALSEQQKEESKGFFETIKETFSGIFGFLSPATADIEPASAPEINLDTTDFVNGVVSQVDVSDINDILRNSVVLQDVIREKNIDPELLKKVYRPGMTAEDLAAAVYNLEASDASVSADTDISAASVASSIASIGAVGAGAGVPYAASTPDPVSYEQESMSITGVESQRSQSVSQVATSSGPASIPPGIGAGPGPIPDGDYDKLSAAARGDLS